jgi:hypothetical protein
MHVNNKNRNVIIIIIEIKSRGSSVDIATCYGPDDRGVEVEVGEEFSLVPVIRTGSGAHPASYPVVDLCIHHPPQ